MVNGFRMDLLCCCLAVIGSAISQDTALFGDSNGITVQVPAGKQLFVQVGDTGLQEVVLKTQLDNVQNQLDALTQKVNTLLDLPDRVTKVESDVTDLNSRVETLETVTNPPTPAPTPTPTPAPTPTPTPAPTVPTLDCSDSDGVLNGTKNGCPKWRKVTPGDIIDAKTFNVNITIMNDENDGANVIVDSKPTAKGCGTDPLRSHSSMGIYIAGAWIKMRYRMSFLGRASCFSIFGANRYNEHEHTSLLELEPGRAYIDNLANADLGAELGGLFEFDSSIDKILSQSDSVSSSAIDDIKRNGGNHCNPKTTVWSQNIGVTRTITVELRRHYTLYEGVKQYDPTAGPSAGASCISLKTMSWQFDNMEILE